MTARLNARKSKSPASVRQGGEVSEMQRRRLLLAIGEVIGESGLETATVGRICEQAGVSRRTFYELFPDREACLLAAFDQAIGRLTQILLPAYRKQGPWRARVRGALVLFLEQLDTEPDLARLCVVESLRAGPGVRERRNQVLEALASIVDEGRQESRVGSEPPPLTAQGVVGGALSVIHARLPLHEGLGTGGPNLAMVGTESKGASRRAAGRAVPGPLVELTAPLMAMIVHPYLGAAAARAELKRPAPKIAPDSPPRPGGDPFKGLPIRFTYRTARVLATIADDPGASNRHIADSSGVADEGQMSRLLGRLRDSGLIENRGQGQAKGEPNAWMLTDRGQAIHTAIAICVTP
jgi:AcrR family transcriptional regulator